MRCLMTSIYLELETEPLRRPFRAFCNLGPEPRACALGCPAGPLRGPYLSAVGDSPEFSPAVRFQRIARDTASPRGGFFLDVLLEELPMRLIMVRVNLTP